MYCFKKLLTWARNPASVFCRISCSRHLPIGGKGPEMVEPDFVKKHTIMHESAYPPLEPISAMHFPTVSWHSPELTIYIKIIRRDACYGPKGTISCKRKKLRMSPYIRGIVAYIHWYVA